MTKFTKVAVAALAALTLTAGAANAGPKKWGPVGVGLGLGLLATGIVAAAANEAAYADGYRTCRWVANYNAFGDYVGSRKVCYID